MKVSIKEIIMAVLLSTVLINCSKEAVDDSYTFFAPDAFAPGSGGRNNEWYITGTGISTENFHLKIMDSDFYKVFETTDYYEHWSGRINHGVLVTEGTYYFLVHFETLQGNEIRKEGCIEVIR